MKISTQEYFIMRNDPLINKDDIKRLLEMPHVENKDWQNEASRLYLIVKHLFDKSFVGT